MLRGLHPSVKRRSAFRTPGRVNVLVEEEEEEEEDFALNRPGRGLLGSTRLRRRSGRSPMVAAEGPLSQRLGKVAVSTRVVATPPAVPSTRYWEIVIPDARAVTSV